MQQHSNMGPARTIDDLVVMLMKKVECLAWKYCQSSQEGREDLVSVAWVAIMEAVRFKSLLEKSDPCAAAMAVAKYAMMAEYNRGHGDILGRPFRKDKVVPVDRTQVLSLDMPLSSDSNASLLDLVPDSSSHSSSQLSESVQRALDEAISRLPARQRVAVCCRNGLTGYGAHELDEVASLVRASTRGAAHNLDYYGRKALRSDELLCKAVGVEVGQC